MANLEDQPSKNETEKPVPTSWRPTLVQIASRFAAGDYTLTSRPVNVRPIAPDLAGMIAFQIASYGDELTELLDESWERAIYLWMGEHWEVLVDLCTKEQGVSDLGLFVNVYEQNADFVFQVWSVHVP